MSIPAGLAQGIALFNQGDFYDCHDTLEAVWLEAAPGDKNFYQGILQIAVAHYHLSRHNWQGAVVLLGEGIRRLKPFAPVYQGVQLDPFIAASRGLLVDLQAIAPDTLPQWLAQGGYHPYGIMGDCPSEG